MKPNSEISPDMAVGAFVEGQVMATLINDKDYFLKELDKRVAPTGYNLRFIYEGYLGYGRISSDTRTVNAGDLIEGLLNYVNFDKILTLFVSMQEVIA